MARGIVAHLIRLVLWRGTAGEELHIRVPQYPPTAPCTVPLLEPMCICRSIIRRCMHSRLWGLTQLLSGYPRWSALWAGCLGCAFGPLAGELDGRTGPILPPLGCGGDAGMSVNSRHECSVGTPQQVVSFRYALHHKRAWTWA